jgi:hypothetical protein
MTTPLRVLPLLASLLLLVGCSSTTPSVNKPVIPEGSAATTGVPSPSAAPWTEVTDGTWAYGDASLGQAVTRPTSEYSISMSGPPSLATSDGGETVTMTSPLTVARVEDRGFGEPITESENFFFMPGVVDDSNMSETYGTLTDVQCDAETIAVGESTSCTVSFTAPAREIQNSHWMINGQNAAAWPGQVAS